MDDGDIPVALQCCRCSEEPTGRRDHMIGGSPRMHWTEHAMALATIMCSTIASLRQVACDPDS